MNTDNGPWPLPLAGPLPRDFPALVQDMARAGSPEDLAQTHARLETLLGHWRERGLNPGRIGILAASVRDQLISRGADLVLRDLPDPGPLGLAVLGSEGRREQDLATDQDNALVLGPGADPQKALDFAQALMAVLKQAGIPPCPHQVTADNPLWRLSAQAWAENIEDMASQPDEQAVLRLSILADLRPVWGQAELVLEVSGHLRHTLRQSTMALRLMALEATRFAPPLGLWGQLAPDHGQLDLKRGGIFPLTQGARVLALELGSPWTQEDTSTAARLSLAGAARILSRETSLNLIAAHGFFRELRLRAQTAQLAQGQAPDNSLAVAGLSGPERSRLKDCLGAVAGFQELLAAKYALHLLT